MKCKVIIDNGIDEAYVSKGMLDVAHGAFVVIYKLDGDDCKLIYSDGTVTQTRKGNVNLKMSFSLGKETQCTLGSGEYTGTFPVFTNKLDVKADNGGVEILLGYVCAGESKRLLIKAE